MPQNVIPGDTINIFGSGFGGDTGSVQFGKAATVPIVMWSSRQIIAQIPSGSGSIDVVVRTKGSKDSEAFRFTYGPKLGDEVIQQARDWAKTRIPEAERRLKEAEERMWEAYVKAEEAYREMKETKGTEVFQDIDKVIVAAGREAASVATEHLLSVLQKQAEKQGEKGVTVVLPFVARYVLTALDYFEVGRWAAMDAVLVSRNIKSQWYRWAVLRPAVKEYERIQEELDTLKKIAGITTTPPLLSREVWTRYYAYNSILSLAPGGNQL